MVAIAVAKTLGSQAQSRQAVGETADMDAVLAVGALERTLALCGLGDARAKVV